MMVITRSDVEAEITAVDRKKESGDILLICKQGFVVVESGK